MAEEKGFLRFSFSHGLFYFILFYFSLEVSNKWIRYTYILCLPGSLDKSDCKVSSFVLSIVIFLRAVDIWRCICDPESGNELLWETMSLTSSTSFDASLSSRIHGSEDDAIAPDHEQNVFTVSLKRKGQRKEKNKAMNLDMFRFRIIWSHQNLATDKWELKPENRKYFIFYFHEISE